MAGSRNMSIRTPLQKVSQTTDGTRPPGLTTMVPARLFRDFGGKTKGTFRANPTAASVVRSKTHRAWSTFHDEDWATIFGQEQYGSYGTPAYDAGGGEFSNTQYGNVTAIDGAFASADSRMLNDVQVVSGNNVIVLDTKLSRDGRYTYTLCVDQINGGSSGGLYFNVFDNTTGTQRNPTLASSPLSGGGPFTGNFTVTEITSAYGNITVVDDTTGEDPAHHMAYNSAVFVVQLLNNNGGTFTAPVLTFRYDFVTNNIDQLDTAGALSSHVTPPVGAAVAWAEAQIVVQSGTMQFMVAYRTGFAGSSNIQGTVDFALFTAFAAGAVPAFASQEITNTSVAFPEFVFSAPPTTAVSRRGAISSSRRFYIYGVLVAVSGELQWYVLNPATFFSAGVADQLFSMPASGADYIKPKAISMPPAFVDGGSTPYMFVALIQKKIGATTTTIDCFLHKTSTTADTAGSVVNIVTTGSVANVFELGLGVMTDADTDSAPAARVAVAYLHPSTLTYTLTEARCLNPTSPSSITPTTVITSAGSTNTVLNAVETTLLAGRFAFAMSTWDGANANDRNDLQSIVFSNSNSTGTFVRTVAPFVAACFVWDTDVYENLPNPLDANTNPRIARIYARGTGANDAGYIPGFISRIYQTTPGYSAADIAQNTTDISGSFSPATSSPASPTDASIETMPVYASSPTASIILSMTDEFTFAIASHGWSGPAQLFNQIQPGMTFVIAQPTAMAGRYTIASVTYDPVNKAVTGFTVSQPVPFRATTVVDTLAYVTAGPSWGIRQIVIPLSASTLSSNRQGNAIFPSVVQIDYASMQTDVAHTEIGEVVVPIEAGSTPKYVQVQIQGWHLSGNVPTDVTAGINISISLDQGTTWVTKVLESTNTSLNGVTTATSFGVQAFIGADGGGTPWSSVPAGILTGDYLFIASGPNAGRYVITGVADDAVVGHRVFVDRPFPVPGNSTVVAWSICSAKDDTNPANNSVSTYGMNFDTSGLPITGSNIHVRVECKDQTPLHDVTYEFDSIAVQWTP